MARPHVLYFMCDQMQYQRQGRIDSKAFTPNLDRFADEGVSFSHFFCANGQCVPSRVSMQTGLYPHEAQVMIIYGFQDHSAHLTGAELTVGDVFREAGYTTAYFGKTHFGTSLESLGYDVGFDVERQIAPKVSEADRIIGDHALGYLEAYDPNSPLFLTVSLIQPHPPFELVDEFAEHYPLELMELPESYWRDDLSTKPAFQRAHALDGLHGTSNEEILRTELRQYYTMISRVDKQFGEIRAALEKKGMWENTIVVFTTDHGDMMGAHRTRLKGTLPYDELYRIPLILKIPGERFPRTIVDDLSVNVGLPGLLVEAAGLVAPAEFKGRSLLPAMRRDNALDDEIIFYEHYGAYWGVHPFRAARTRAWKYVKYYGPDQTEELYDLRTDPSESVNRAGDPTLAQIQSGLERQVDRWWAETDGKDFAYYDTAEFKSRGMPLPTNAGDAQREFEAGRVT